MALRVDALTAATRITAPTGARGEKIRVLRVIARLNVGGPAIHATLLSRGLDPERYEQHLVAGAEELSEGNYLELFGQSVDRLHVVPALGRELHPWRDRRAAGAIAALIAETRPHIVHTHTAKAGVLGRWAAWRAGVPVIVHTFHGHVFDGYFPPVKTALFVRAERALARITTRLVTVSEEVRRQILARGIGRPDRFDVIRLGLDLDRFVSSHERTGELRRELGLGPAAKTIGIVARLVPIKAHEVFLAAAAEIARRIPEAVFIVVGDGERRPALEALAQDLGLRSRVRFLGWRADLDRVYADLDIVMLTSRNEGSPVALIEAMAAARPVVATRAGGVAELVGEAGLTAGIDDVQGLVRHVLAVCTDPEAGRALGAAARERVVPWYSHTRLIDDMDGLYRRLLSETGGRPA